MGTPLEIMNKSEYISLRQYLLEKLTEIKDLENERWKAHEQFHEQGQKAFDAAMSGIDMRMHTMNEFRSQVLEDRAAFVKIELYETKHKALEQKLESAIDRVAVKISELEKYRSNMDGRLWMLATVVGAGLTLTTIGLNLLFRYWPR